MWNFDVSAKEKMIYFAFHSHHWCLYSFKSQQLLSLCVFISVSSKGSGLWESIPAGHPAVSASLLSDSGPFEASLWSSVQPHYVWAAKGTCVHKHFSCTQLQMLIYHLCGIHTYAVLSAVPFVFSQKPSVQCELAIVPEALIAHCALFILCS